MTKVDGPVFLAPFKPCIENVDVIEMKNLDGQEMIEIHNLRDPIKNRYRKGPLLAKLQDPWERFGVKSKCQILDQDDYIVIRDVAGNKEVLRGPLVYMPKAWGEIMERKSQSVQVPVNHYIKINDADSTTDPIVHVRGPIKWYPKPFQTLTFNKTTGLNYWPCIEVTTQKAIHLQRASGVVEIIDQPTFYMPEVGEKVLCTVERQVLLTNDFCVLKCPDGTVRVKNGSVKEDRSFFPKPFEEFLTFSCETTKTVLSTLPTFMSHKFNVRTSDNVVIELDTRISYRISDVNKFCTHPIDFFSFIKNHVQNALLDKFAQSSLRDFMNSFSKIAFSTIEPTNVIFQDFGIHIDDLQILKFQCTNTRTQELLTTDIHTNVTKQNELRAAQNDILIQEQANEVKRRQKDLEVQMCMKDNQVALQQKILENSIRIKEMEIEIQEEIKRTELLEVRRGNDLVEAEFEGRAKGHEFREFLLGIDPKLSTKEKMSVYMKQCDLKQARSLYAKANKMSVYPNDVDIKTFQMPSAEDAELMKKSYMNGIGFGFGQQSQTH